MNGDGLGHVHGLVGQLLELEHVASAQEGRALRADVALEVAAEVAAPACADGGDAALLDLHRGGEVGVVGGEGVDGAPDVGAHRLKLAAERGQQVPLVGDGLDGKAAGKARIGTPGGGEPGAAEAVAGADAIVEYVDGIAQRAGAHKLDHLLEGGAIAVGEADDDLAVVLLLHLLDEAGVFEVGGDGLFHVKRDVMLQHHLHIVQPLRRRRAEHNVIGLGDVFLQLIVAQHFAAELRLIALHAFGIDIEAGVDLAAQLDHSAAMGIGDVAGADHQNIHRRASCVLVML